MSEVKLDTPLSASQIDFRIQSINKGGYATILAYKNARTDMDRLDKVVGIYGWSREHFLINNKEYCKVSLYDKDLGQWVSKMDCGKESFSDSEKGESSDAFKRACFNWGIGRELYSYPAIQVKLYDDEFKVDGNKVKATWKLNLKSWRWRVYFKNNSVSYIDSRDQNGKVRFEYWSIDGLSESISIILDGISSGDLIKSAEVWRELSEGEKACLWVAKTKGGPFSQQEKEVIKSTEFQSLCID